MRNWGTWATRPIHLSLNLATMTALLWFLVGLVLAGHAWFYPWSHSVYDIYSYAARNWLAGNDLYLGGRDYFRYSPLFAALVTPFGILEDYWGNPLWKIFNMALYAFSLLAWAEQGLPGRPLSRNQRAGLLLLVLPSSLHSIYNGQANIMMLSACLLGMTAAARERWSWTAGFLALATLIKGYPLALAMLVVALYPKRFGPRYLLGLVLGMVLPFVFRPAQFIGQTSSWLHHMSESTGLLRYRSRSIDYLFEVYYHPLAAETFTKIGVLAGGGILALCLIQSWHSREPRQLLTRTFLLFVTWVVLFIPATETSTYVVIAPAIAWKVLDSFRQQTSWFTRLGLIASLLMTGPLVTDLFGSTVRVFAVEHGSQPAGALLFLGILLAETRGGAKPQAAQMLMKERTVLAVDGLHWGDRHVG